MARFRRTLAAFTLLAAGAGYADPPDTEAMRRAVDDNVGAAFSLYREFLSLPNDALAPADIEALVNWMEDAFAARGFRTQRLPTAGNPSLFAERIGDPAARTVLIYLQADGQPVDPSAWAQADPFVPVLKGRDEEGNWQQIPWQSLDDGRRAAGAGRSSSSTGPDRASECPTRPTGRRDG